MDLNNIKVDLVLDTKGLSCPMPMLKTKKTIGKLEAGQIMEIIGTDPGSKNDIPEWATRSGHQFLGGKDEGGVFRFFIQKG
ncbi:MAG: preprotein translocase subunit TatC [Deltaproteobacteria bacterium RIFOXYD12_FULL_50_9]|nr:MAG: preprotein translocase subunit TatC [Deltaproteobacteria bacterium RIFOXYD12_FULL_50_9]